MASTKRKKPTASLPQMPDEIVQIQRTSVGLREALFDAMERVIGRRTSAPEANALARLSEQIQGTVYLEIEVQKLRSRNIADGGGNSAPAILSLGGGAPK